MIMRVGKKKENYNPNHQKTKKVAKNTHSHTRTHRHGHSLYTKTGPKIRIWFTFQMQIKKTTIIK